MYGYVPKEKQVEATRFILKNLEEVSDWLINPKVAKVVGPQMEVLSDRDRYFELLLSKDIMNRLQITELDGKKNYSLDDFMN